MTILDDVHPSNLRYLFYLVTPNETTFASIDDVPDYTKITSVWMTILLLTELLFLKKEQYSFNDSVTSATSGIAYLLFKFSGKYLSAALYGAVYNKIHLVSLDPSSLWVWLLCFLTEDFAYYLAHRCMHECGIFWAFHQMHHSSEYYNLSTAFRKGVFLEVGACGFELTQALIIPPPIFLLHKYLNLLYQFWLHTELVPKLGPLEYILNTPSAHRVHHGRNPYCIVKMNVERAAQFFPLTTVKLQPEPVISLRWYFAKRVSLYLAECATKVFQHRNYAGTLIIWDRLFGTYAEEKEDERILYGLVDNVRSFNALWLQYFDLAFFLVWKGQISDPSTGQPCFPTLKDKIFSIFAPPGYYPGVKTRRFFWWWYVEDNTYGIPQVDYSVPKYNPPLSTAKILYIASQLVFLVSFVLPFYDRRMEMDWFEFIAQLGIICSTIQIFGFYFDNDDLAPFHDRLRCFGMLAYILRYPSTSLTLLALVNLVCIQYFETEIAERTLALREEKEKKEKEEKRRAKREEKAREAKKVD